MPKIYTTISDYKLIVIYTFFESNNNKSIAITTKINTLFNSAPPFWEVWKGKVGTNNYTIDI